MQPLFANYKAKRIQHILSAPPSTVLSKPWVKRALSVIAVVSSYLALAALILIAPRMGDGQLLATEYVIPLQIANYLPWIMLISFVLLRRSTRRITSLPNEYLDEREIANRDWAFRLGYIVIRRVGLAITALVIASIVLQYLFAWTTWTSRDQSLLSKFYAALNTYLVDSFATAPIAIVSGYIVLLTYVAYSFPVILLAWREAASVKAVELPVDASETWPAAILYYTTSYRKRIRWVLGCLGYVLVSFALIQTGIFYPMFTISGVLITVLYLILIPGSLYALYVYVWALFAQTRIVKLLAEPGVPERARLARSAQFVLLVVASLVGMLVPATWWVGATAQSTEWGMSFFWLVLSEGATLIVVQISAFRLAKKVALAAR